MRAYELLNEDQTDDEKNISILVNKLTKAADAYYNTGDTIMSDADYDALEAMLRDLDPDNPYFIGIGSDSRGGKVKLPVTMGSLDQAHEGETSKWVGKESLNDVDMVASDKLDGNSILLVYSDTGNLQIAFTRGNGEYGQDVTRHVKQMASVPQTGVEGIRFVVAEVIMIDSTFNRIKNDLERETGRAYKNPRNFVAGQMNKKVSTPLFYKNVDVVTFGLRDKNIDKVEQYNKLKDNNFITAGYTVFKGSQLNDNDLTAYLNTRHDASPYALDGLVLDINDAGLREKMESSKTASTLNPAYAKKFKVGQADNVATSKVVTVHWKVSKDGYIKPRVEIEPVDLVGVTVTFATGFNAKFIVDNNIGEGAEITITRSGDVIPFIKGIVTPAENPGLPDSSVVGEYSWSAPNAKGDRVDFILDDVESSSDVKLQRLLQFFSSIGLEFISKKGIAKLYQAGYDTPEDIITASVGTVQGIVGNANGQKGMASLKSKLTNVKPWMLAGSHPAFGRGVGRRKLKKVFDHHGKILGLSMDELVSVPSIEMTTARKIQNAEMEYKAFLNSISGHYSLDDAPEVKVTGGPLVGLSFAFTGYRDKDANARIEELGGEVHSSVRKDTTHLVAKNPNSGSGKLVKAQQRGVTIIGIDELQRMIS